VVNRAGPEERSEAAGYTVRIVAYTTSHTLIETTRRYVGCAATSPPRIRVKHLSNAHRRGAVE
jgi:hypothetical protein